jgi:hypothetical protein
MQRPLVRLLALPLERSQQMLLQLTMDSMIVYLQS